MPDNEAPGELEDFVAGMIPESDPVWPRSQEPRMMGAAIRARDLSRDAPDAVRLVDWLRRLFS